MEVITVMVILLVLMTMITTGWRGFRDRSMQTACMANMRHVYVVSLAYARDHRNLLPVGNVYNPQTFKSNVAEKLDEYMQQRDLQAHIWYCPAGSRVPEDLWLNKSQRHYVNYREYVIGYVYFGNPYPSTRMYKYLRPVPIRIYDLDPLTNAQMPFLADSAATRRSTRPPTADQVETWSTFNHYSKDNARYCNVVLGGGGVVSKTKDEMRLSYQYHAPVDLYW